MSVPEVAKMVNMQVKFELAWLYPQGELDRSEIGKAINTIKIRKAPGTDGTIAEMLRAMQ